MLSNVGILEFIKSGDIYISPWSEKDLDACRIILHLADKLLSPQEDNTVIDPKNGILPKYNEIIFTENIPFRLEPGMFVLGETFEQIGLSEKVAALMDGRSTFARVGLTIHQTSMLVDAGQKPKKMTLEIKNMGMHTILLYPKMRICRMFFFLLTPPATLRYDTAGRYQSTDPNKPILGNEF